MPGQVAIMIGAHRLRAERRRCLDHRHETSQHAILIEIIGAKRQLCPQSLAIAHFGRKIELRRQRKRRRLESARQLGGKHARIHNGELAVLILGIKCE